MSKRVACPNISEFKNKLETGSKLIRDLSISNKIIKDYNVEMLPSMYNVFCSKEKMDELVDIIEYLYIEKEAAVTKIVKELLSNKTFDGLYFELRTYEWLRDCNAEFIYQPEEKTLSISKVKLDGAFITPQIYFDIKTFELGENIKQKLKLKLEEEFPKYIFLVDGRIDQDYKILERKVLSQIYDHIRNIDIYNHPGDYSIKDTDWTIKWYERKMGIYMEHNSFNPYEWAQNNERFFLKNVTQYTSETPFILICTMPEVELAFNQEIALRALARRAFINLPKMNLSEMFPKGVINYGKIQQEYRPDITRYLSGIFFLDLKCEKAYMYLNPNAIHKVSISDLHRIFNYNIPAIGVIDDFQYDNY